MTHQELLAKIDNLPEVIGLAEFKVRHDALRAIVELHPMWTGYKYNETGKELVEFCGCCQEKWPCKTIQVIEKELQ